MQFLLGIVGLKISEFVKLMVEIFCKFNLVLPTIIFYMIQIGLRLPSLVLLTIYLGDWFGLFLAALLPVNFTLASLNLKTLTAKNVWTGLMSTLAPICFVAKDKIKDHHSKTFVFFCRMILKTIRIFFPQKNCLPSKSPF